MKIPFALVSSLTNVEPRQSVRFLSALRLCIVTVAALALFSWQHFYLDNRLDPLVFVVLGATTLWSIAVLMQTGLQAAAHAELREVIIDLAWIFAVVFLAGRAANPFIYYFLVVVALGACILRFERAWLVCGLSIALYTFILVIDAQAHFDHFETSYKLHLVGMWLNYLISTFVTCYFVTQLMTVLRQQQQKMQDFREDNLKNEQLIGLATVSASAVHNLATPLSTLRLLIGELATNKDLNPQVHEDLSLMLTQIQRCQGTMKELASLAQNSDDKYPLQVDSLVTQLRDHYALHFPNNEPGISKAGISNIEIQCNALFYYALINLINNAVESSNNKAAVNISSTDKNIIIEISNHCNTDAEQFLARWGKPTLSEKSDGLGIGSMLANSTIERQGGSVSLSSSSLEKHSEYTNEITVTVLFPISIAHGAVQ